MWKWAKSSSNCKRRRGWGKMLQGPNPAPAPVALWQCPKHPYRMTSHLASCHHPQIEMSRGGAGEQSLDALPSRACSAALWPSALTALLAGRRCLGRSEQDPGRAGAGGWETPGWREMFSPEQIQAGGSGGGRGPISGPFPSWAAALRLVRSHSPVTTQVSEDSFFYPHAPSERDPCGSRVS